MAQALVERALPIVRSVIDAWDPYGLLASGAPEDEFASESLLIAEGIERVVSPAEAAKLISHVFAVSFDADSFSVEKCTSVGLRLFEELKRQGLVA